MSPRQSTHVSPTQVQYEAVARLEEFSLAVLATNVGWTVAIVVGTLLLIMSVGTYPRRMAVSAAAVQGANSLPPKLAPVWRFVPRQKSATRGRGLPPFPSPPNKVGFQTQCNRTGAIA